MLGGQGSVAGAAVEEGEVVRTAEGCGWSRLLRGVLPAVSLLVGHRLDFSHAI